MARQRKSLQRKSKLKSGRTSTATAAAWAELGDKTWSHSVRPASRPQDQAVPKKTDKTTSLRVRLRRTVEDLLSEYGYSDDDEEKSAKAAKHRERYLAKRVSPAHVGDGYSAKIPSTEMQRRFNTPTDSEFLQNDNATDPVMSNGHDAKCRGGVSAARQRHHANLAHKRSQRKHSDDRKNHHFRSFD
eukprot:COSAG06_NODE_11199_length_1547_cov_1.750691_2_plen_187_part_00